MCECNNKKNERFIFFRLALSLPLEIFKEYHEGNSFGEIIIFNGKPAYGEVTVTSDKCTLFKMTKQFFLIYYLSQF